MTAGISTPYAPRRVGLAWVAAAVAGLGYGVALIVLALRCPPGDPLTGHWVGQPAGKAAMAVLLAVAATAHPLRREARRLVAALACSAAGDFLLAIPWWPPSFTAGLGAFLLAHLCFLAALVPLAAPSRARLTAVAALAGGCVGLLVWFWPGLIRAGLTVPVTAYVLVLGAMVAAALLAGLPTGWTAYGALCFAASDAMIGADRFVFGGAHLAVSIWWFYAAAQLSITYGLFFGRAPHDAGPAEVPASAPSAKPAE